MKMILLLVEIMLKMNVFLMILEEKESFEMKNMFKNVIK